MVRVRKLGAVESGFAGYKTECGLRSVRGSLAGAWGGAGRAAHVSDGGSGGLAGAWGGAGRAAHV